MMLAVPPFRANASDKGLSYDALALTAHLAALCPGSAIIIMIHGYRHEPGHPRECPHDHILSASPCSPDPRVISWPAALRLDGKDTMGIAFGWPARGSIWGAYRRAGLAGRQLAHLVCTLPPDRPVHIIAHSLGARVALRAISLLPPARVQRVILMAAAELRRPARRAAARAQGTDIINICTRDNWFFDAGLAWIISAGLDAGLGHGLGHSRGHGRGEIWGDGLGHSRGDSWGDGLGNDMSAQWYDLHIDDPATRASLSDLGHAVGAAHLRMCHWSSYLRPGAFGLYRALLTGQLPLATLRAHMRTRDTDAWHTCPDTPAFGTA